MCWINLKKKQPIRLKRYSLYKVQKPRKTPCYFRNSGVFCIFHESEFTGTFLWEEYQYWIERYDRSERNTTGVKTTEVKNKPGFQFVSYWGFLTAQLFLPADYACTVFSLEQGSVAGKSMKLQLSKFRSRERGNVFWRTFTVSHVSQKGCGWLENLSYERATWLCEVFLTDVQVGNRLGS